MHDLREQVYSRLLAQLNGCTKGTQRRQYIALAAETLGLSEATVYRHLKARGWSSGRRRRCDRGQSRVSLEDCAAVARVMAKGRNKRGQANVPAREAISLARDRGLVPEDISDSQVMRRMRQHGLSGMHMRAPAPAISRVSSHPNHVWFIDVSVGIQWYFRDGDGKRLALYSDGDRRFYEGKRQNLVGRDRVLLRYLVVDHYSGAYFVRYYYESGEKAVDVIDFLFRAMAPKGPGDAFPLRGIPKRIVVDQGPAFKSQIVRNALDGLGVEVEFHAPGNAKASGAVESRHNHWQRTFEGRLALRPARDLVEINEWAEKFAAVANAERPHSRHNKPPMVMWASISPQQLVEAPDRETFLQLATTSARTGTLNNRLQLRADGRTWEIAGPAVFPGQKVQFRLAPLTDVGIRVWDAERRPLAATELSFDEAGFPQNGRRHVWDDESAPGATAPAPAAQKLSAAVASEEDTVQMDDVFDDLDERLRRQAFLATQRGQEWQPGASAVDLGEALISSIEAREQVAAQLGRPLSADEGAWWRQRVGDGCTQADLEQAFAEFRGDVAPSTAVDHVG